MGNLKNFLLKPGRSGFALLFAVSTIILFAACDGGETWVCDLDPEHPVGIGEHVVVYGDTAFALGRNAFLVGPGLVNESCHSSAVQNGEPGLSQKGKSGVVRSKYHFSSVNEALEHIHDGTESEPMTLYLLPGVYWLDDPDDEVVRRPVNGKTPFAVEVNCNHLHILGLNPDPQNVVLAVNRGQMAGADGNFTMMHLTGDDIHVENVTFGNYCNVDLVFPLDTARNRLKRTSSITQSQLILCNSDKVRAENCSFVSRLNACPFVGSRRALFRDCHIECGDDALCGSGIYYGCDLDFYSSKPFWSTFGTGAVFLDCDFTIHNSAVQYMNKVGSQVALVDCRFHGAEGLKLAWTKYPAAGLRCYQCGVTLNGKPVIFNGYDRPDVTVQIEGKRLLDAYRFEYDGKPYYNLYGLTRGDDGWDPADMKAVTEAAGIKAVTEASDMKTVADAEDVKTVTDASFAEQKADVVDQVYDYASLPVQLRIKPEQIYVETGGDSVILKTECFRFYDIPVNHSVVWHVPDDAPLQWQADDTSCVIKGCNNGETPVSCLIMAKTEAGLEAAVELTVCPQMLPAPQFVSQPQISCSNGVLSIKYELENQGDVKRPDKSYVTWYRCADVQGSKAIPVAVTRYEPTASTSKTAENRSGLNFPEYNYKLSSGDLGYYIMATVEPRNSRSETGKPFRVMTEHAVSQNDLSEVAQILVLKSGCEKNALNSAAKDALNVTAKDASSKKVCYETDFHNFPTTAQKEIIPGFWTVDAYKPLDTNDYPWRADASKGWTYGTSQDGAVGSGLLQTTQGARLLYTPVEGCIYGDMDLTWQVDPCKTAAQGFGSATGQYMDLYIKFDTKTLTGYALRIERTPKYANAVDFTLVQYENGKVMPITESVSATCYLTGCTIHIKTQDGSLYADVKTTTLKPSSCPSELPHEVHLSAPITMTSLGGYGLQHTGTAGASATMLHHLNVVTQL